MKESVFSGLVAEISALRPTRVIGRVADVSANKISVSGLSAYAALGDIVRVTRRSGREIGGEVIGVDRGQVMILPEGAPEGVQVDDPVLLVGPVALAPHKGWIGRVIDPFGRPLDGRPMFRGRVARPLTSAPPPPGQRRAMGGRLSTGLAVFDTMLPLVRGQRIGLFAGSGVGKSSLLGKLARGVRADLVVIALVGERGREVRDFVEDVLGREGLARAVVVAATSDRSPLERRRAALSAMTVAEHFRDEGLHVLYLADSVTRFAEAHREVALAAGETPALGGYPPSLAGAIMGLAERAGPGAGTSGDITAVFSVLVAGSDMDEPVADILRGVLDGHVVLDRSIAERGRFPAVDILRSVSRSLPAAATIAENRLITRVRQLLGVYSRSEALVQSGLYTAGSDRILDDAIRLWPEIDRFLSEDSPDGPSASFSALAERLGEPWGEDPGDTVPM